jgi:NTP pyrophosphatase (non-canonical NTP hydrolase)
MSLKDTQKQVDDWINSVGVRYFNELTNLGQLVEEVGELSRILIRTYGEQSSKKSDLTKADLADEMADVLFVLTCLANQTGVDLDDAFKRNMAKKTNRDKNRHKQNKKLQDEQ